LFTSVIVFYISWVLTILCLFGAAEHL